MKNKTKIIALRENGTLNSSPNKVLDNLFHTHDFFDAYDILQVKYEMIRRVLTDGWEITKTTRHFGFSRPAFYQILKAFKQEGLIGLFPKKRGPKYPHKLNNIIIDFIKKTIKKSPAKTPDSLAKTIKSQFGVSIHPRSITRILSTQEKPQKKIL